MSARAPQTVAKSTRESPYDILPHMVALRFRRRGAPAARLTVSLLALGLLAGCTGSPPAPPPAPDPDPSVDERLARLVPEAIRSDGKLTVGTDPSYPPMSFTTPDGASVQGVDVDLISGIATVLGLTPVFNEDAFTALPVAVRTGRVEVGISALTVRLPHRLTDAVLYYRSGSQLVRNNRAPGLTTDTMCGTTIAVLEGSYQVVQLKTASRNCVASGQNPVSIEALSDQRQVTRAALSVAAGMLTDTPVASYSVQQHPDRLTLAGEPVAPAPLGMLTAPELPRLARAIRGALQRLIDSGYYDQVLRTWGVPEGAVSTARIQWSVRHERQQNKAQRRQ